MLTFDDSDTTGGKGSVKEDSQGVAKRVNVDDKRIINCSTVDVNQLMPLKYKWAWEHYLNGCANNWLPTEDAIYYFHAYYDLHQGIKILNCLGTKQWDHLRTNPTAKFLYENCNETFTYTLAQDIKSVIEQKQIPAEKIYLIVMDEVHRKFLKDRLHELQIYGLKKIVLKTQKNFLKAIYC